MIELTQLESDTLYQAFVDCSVADFSALAAPKNDQQMWADIARWKSFTVESVLATASAQRLTLNQQQETL